MTGTLARDDYQFLAGLLRDHLGHELGDDKDYLLVSRLGPVVVAHDAGDFRGLVRRLRQGHDPALRDAVLEAVSIGETSFFRGSAFDILRRDVLPNLIAARRESRKLRFWSAACSIGPEVYSLAILLTEFAAELADWDVTILGTDASEQAMKRARAGSYADAEVRRGLGDDVIRRFFQPQSGGRWVASPSLRSKVDLRVQNLLRPFEMWEAPFDVILVRNVIIYFERAIKSDLFHRLRSVIANDGYLFLGETESILGMTDQFTLPPVTAGFYRPMPTVP